jgi:tetratricopeptide (TPR) repeat protein
VTGPLLAGLLLLLAQPADPVAGPPPSAGPTASRPGPAAAATSARFEDLWSAFVKADASGDAAAAEKALHEIRRARIERNVHSLDVVGLGLVERGVARLDEGRREEAEGAFQSAVVLAPGVPEAYGGLAVARLKKGPLGIMPSLEATVSGLSAFRASGRGSLAARNLGTVAALLTAFALAWALGVALLLRRGGLLRHDVEEWLGPAQNRSTSLALLLLLLLLPVATFQGWGWLPLWWLAVLFAYLDARERALAVAALAVTLAVGPAAAALDLRLRTARNPLFDAALAAVESAPDDARRAMLEEAVRADPGDRDLVYLLAAACRRAGRYQEAADLYRQVLAADPSDAIARNNLANIEFVHGSYDEARARYRAGTQAGGAAEVVATSYYNLSLAYLQKFEYQAYNEAKSNADRLAPGLVAEYDQWKYDSRDYAVVDLGLTRAQVWDKFAGAEKGVAARNVAAGGRPASGTRVLGASLANRFAAAAALLALAAFLVVRWRGPRAFTLHCARCGTPFCRECHLGGVSGGLCSQCYHLFVVRDGVSGPARSRKMAELQRAVGKGHQLFRVLSVLSPGAGQVYRGWTLRGAALLAVWYGVLSLFVAGRLVPFAEVPRRLSTPWLPLAGAAVLALVWLVANRFRPEPELELPARPARRARAPQVEV